MLAQIRRDGFVAFNVSAALAVGVDPYGCAGAATIDSCDVLCECRYIPFGRFFEDLRARMRCLPLAPALGMRALGMPPTCRCSGHGVILDGAAVVGGSVVGHEDGTWHCYDAAFTEQQCGWCRPRAVACVRGHGVAVAGRALWRRVVRQVSSWPPLLLSPDCPFPFACRVGRYVYYALKWPSDIAGSGSAFGGLPIASISVWRWAFLLCGVPSVEFLCEAMLGTLLLLVVLVAGLLLCSVERLISRCRRHQRRPYCDATVQRSTRCSYVALLLCIAVVMVVCTVVLLLSRGSRGDRSMDGEFLRGA